MFKSIRTIRQEKGMTQEELAYKAHVSRGILSDLETGKRVNTTAGTLVKLAKALGCSVCDFLPYSSNPLDVQEEEEV